MPAVAGEIWDVPFFGGILHGDRQGVEIGATRITVAISLDANFEWTSEYDVVQNHLPMPDGSMRHLVCAVWAGPITKEHLEEYRDYLHLHLEGGL